MLYGIIKLNNDENPVAGNKKVHLMIIKNYEILNENCDVKNFFIANQMKSKMPKKDMKNIFNENVV